MDHQPANPVEPIDEERMRAYVALIDKLLLGARENANSGRMNAWNFGISGRILIKPLLDGCSSPYSPSPSKLPALRQRH